MNTTDTLRRVMLVVFVVTVAVVLGGWLFHRDPSQLSTLLGIEALGLGIGEASNVGKRATFKTEAAQILRVEG